MEGASALARPLTDSAALWGRAQRLGVKVQEIADLQLKVTVRGRPHSTSGRGGRSSADAPPFA